MRILLTGGAGYLGSRLSVELAVRGHVAHGVDRLDGDLAESDVAWELIEHSQADVVVHLAAQPGRVFGERDPEHTLRSNVLTTIKVARACAAAGSALCYVSTSEVYGTACDGGQIVNERTPLGEPRNLYAATKAWGEQAARLYAPLNLSIVRPSMPYGPGMEVGEGRSALPSMIASFLRGEPYEVHNCTKRSWCYVDDLIRGMADVIERGAGVYNVGRDDDLRSMAKVARIVCDTLMVDKDLLRIVEPDHTITRVKDISMTKLRRLGWEPNVDLPEGIELMAESLR